jgi:hypothetical protein
MGIQQARKPVAKVEVTGRPLWQVSLKAWIQRGEKRVKRGWARVFKAVRPVRATSPGTRGVALAAKTDLRVAAPERHRYTPLSLAVKLTLLPLATVRSINRPETLSPQRGRISPINTSLCSKWASW